MEPQAQSTWNVQSDVLLEDKPCKRCGYNLRGLSEAGRCPECGTSIRMSLRGDLLRFSDPEWMDKVATGLGIIFWMMVLGLLGGMLISLVSAGDRLLGAVLGLVAQGISFYGVWLMTEPDPSHVGQDKWAAARRVVRITLIIGLTAYPLQVLIENGGLRPEFEIASYVLIAILGLIGLYGEFAKFQYYEWLARRVPDHKLGDRAKFLRWAYVVSLGVVTVAGAIGGGLLAAGGGIRTGGMNPAPAGVVGGALVCIALPFGIAMLVFGVMTFLMIWRLRWHVKQQAIEARQEWTDRPPVPPLPT